MLTLICTTQLNKQHICFDPHQVTHIYNCKTFSSSFKRRREGLWTKLQIFGTASLPLLVKKTFPGVQLRSAFAQHDAELNNVVAVFRAIAQHDPEWNNVVAVFSAIAEPNSEWNNVVAEFSTLAQYNNRMKQCGGSIQLELGTFIKVGRIMNSSKYWSLLTPHLQCTFTHNNGMLFWYYSWYIHLP